jgi:hypothetical protein
VKGVIKGFREFKRLNEQADIKNVPLRGYSAELIKKRLYELVDVMPDRMKIGVPSDNKGYSITYRDLNGAIQKIEDKIKSGGGFGKDGENLRLDKIVSYFTKNREDADNVRSISISIDSESIRKEKLSKSQEPSKEDIYPSEERSSGQSTEIKND